MYSNFAKGKQYFLCIEDFHGSMIGNVFSLNIDLKTFMRMLRLHI